MYFLTFTATVSQVLAKWYILLPPNSDPVIIIHLGRYNCAIFHTQLIAWEYVQTEQLYPPM